MPPALIMCAPCAARMCRGIIRYLKGLQGVLPLRKGTVQDHGLRCKCGGQHPMGDRCP